MSITLRIGVGCPDQRITAATYGEAFDRAAALGARHAINDSNEVFVFSAGEWIYVCQRREKGTSRRKRRPR